MTKKTKKPENESILYIQDIEAKVLGIIEGSAQKVYIDNREVEVVFVDEHQVIPATKKERKLYDDAHKIAENYSSIYNIDGKLTTNNMVWLKDFYGKSISKIGNHNLIKSKTPVQISLDITRYSNEPEANKSAFSKFSIAKKDKQENSWKLVKDKNSYEKLESNKNIKLLNNKVKNGKIVIKNDTITCQELNVVKDILDINNKNTKPNITNSSNKKNVVKPANKKNTNTSSKNNSSRELAIVKKEQLTAITKTSK